MTVDDTASFEETHMNASQLDRMENGVGFVAALDQSGGSTPGALAAYGVPAESWSTDEQMFDAMHEMRSRVIRSAAFGSDRILAAILFENTMDRRLDGVAIAEYLWAEKGIVPFLKIDQGLEDEEHRVRLMKPIAGFDELLGRAVDNGIFGTKMRSLIVSADVTGIEAVVAQQFEVARQVLAAGLIPVLEPEVDIAAPDKAEAEGMLRDEILTRLDDFGGDERVMLKLTLPVMDDFYTDIIEHPNVVRVVALSGGYSQEDACARLRRNHGLIASFSRALLAGLSAQQPDAEFNAVLDSSVRTIYEASTT